MPARLYQFLVLPGRRVGSKLAPAEIPNDRSRVRDVSSWKRPSAGLIVVTRGASAPGQGLRGCQPKEHNTREDQRREREVPRKI